MPASAAERAVRLRHGEQAEEIHHPHPPRPVHLAQVLQTHQTNGDVPPWAVLVGGGLEFQYSAGELVQEIGGELLEELGADYHIGEVAAGKVQLCGYYLEWSTALLLDPSR